METFLHTLRFLKVHTATRQCLVNDGDLVCACALH